jgi:hypothetical protein
VHDGFDTTQTWPFLNPAPQGKTLAPLRSFQFQKKRKTLCSRGTLAFHYSSHRERGCGGEGNILSRIMATSTEPEGAPPAAKGPKGEANTKGSNEHREVGAGSGGGSQKRKRKEVFIYGNYRNYYGYRVSATASISAPPLWN